VRQECRAQENANRFIANTIGPPEAQWIALSTQVAEQTAHQTAVRDGGQVFTQVRAIAAVVKALLIPGSTAFLIVGLGIGLVLLYFGSSMARWGRRWLSALGILYVALSLPVMSNALIAGLRTDHLPITKLSDARGARTLVVIGDGAVSYVADGRAVHQVVRRTAFGVIEAARLYVLLKPQWVIVSGGIPDPMTQARPESEIMRDELVRLGVPTEHILLESTSRTTAEQLANVVRLIRDKTIGGPVVLVTTPAHARRVMLHAMSHKNDAVPSITTELRYDQGQEGWRQWRPSVDALRGSESAMYEYLAVARLWLAPGSH